MVYFSPQSFYEALFQSFVAAFGLFLVMAERQGNTAEGGVDGAVEGDDLPNDDAEETFPVEEN